MIMQEQSPGQQGRPGRDALPARYAGVSAGFRPPPGARPRRFPPSPGAFAAVGSRASAAVRGTAGGGAPDLREGEAAGGRSAAAGGGSAAVGGFAAARTQASTAAPARSRNCCGLTPRTRLNAALRAKPLP
ncbi:hypothetical protein Kpho01_57750 [Kitasatospora phosalacinea]|uniref:Uncharacterized protein n=1 Tax=Kitasatospora phosalacinea TaxID=2065 RepID=A0A9W6UR07_9ACTN|nr:hypothetical protein Kpho01_57750 [Kitasatospora phosalacinea]